MSEYDYSDNTYNSKNFLVRFSHRNRFKKALSCVMKEKKNDTLLDYGTGDGHFLIELSKEKKFIDLVGFEPIMLPKNNNEIKYNVTDCVQSVTLYLPLYSFILYTINYCLARKNKLLKSI